MMRLFLTAVPVLGFVGMLIVLSLYVAPTDTLTNLIEGAGVVGYISYVALLVLAVVVMPITVMPLIPLAASVIGPFATAVLSIIGWTLGGVIAFLLARYLAGHSFHSSCH